MTESQEPAFVTPSPGHPVTPSGPAADNRIRVRGGRVHNLRSVDLDIPRDRLVVVTGVSGSGKSSLAFDTLFAEGQRRYLESLSTYTRQFLNQLERPDADLIDGLPPTISIEQRTGSVQRRSTLATTTEVYDYLRLLYARAGQAHCTNCGRPVSQQSSQAIVDRILTLEDRRKVMILAPLVRGRKGAHRDVFERIAREGFVRARADGEVVDAADPPKLARTKPHSIEAVVDRIVIKEGIRPRLQESVDLALRHGEGTCLVSHEEEGGWHDQLYSEKFACPVCGVSFPDLEPRTFSFNSAYGACPTCEGLGVLTDADTMESEAGDEAPERICPDCEGSRLNAFARRVTVAGRTITEMTAMTVHEAAGFFAAFTPAAEAPPRPAPPLDKGGLGGVASSAPLPSPSVASEDPSMNRDSGSVPRDPPRPPLVKGGRKTEDPLADGGGEEASGWDLTNEGARVAAKTVPEIANRLRFLDRVGLEYLTLDRPTRTLSGGEYQRARLAGCLGSGLIGVCYILDEPTIGLHPRDTGRLVSTLEDLRDQGNSVLVVEHDVEMMRRADWLIDLGPGAGSEGGRILAAGTPDAVAVKPESVTGRFLHDRTPQNPGLFGETGFLERRPVDPQRMLTLTGARLHHLKNVTLRVPLGVFTCVTGVSGSGKSSLIAQTLVPAVRRALATSPTSPQRKQGAAAKNPSLARRASKTDDPGTGEPPPATYDALTGTESIERLVEVDQSPIGRTARSCPATYCGVWDEIRKVFAQTREARIRGYTARRFSFNSTEGRCPECEGQGVRRIEMNFMPDLHVTCPVCRGARFNRQTLAVRFAGRSAADVLGMRVDEARVVFGSFPRISSVLETLTEVGLGYLTLGQSSLTLSGGEAQRVKLATELSRPGTAPTLFVLDEPTTGLHPADVERLLHVLGRLVDRGHTVLTVEHHLDVMAAADWIIDLGPDGGAAGGEIVAEGPPEAVARGGGHTAAALKAHLDRAA